MASSRLVTYVVLSCLALLFCALPCSHCTDSACFPCFLCLILVMLPTADAIPFSIPPGIQVIHPQPPPLGPHYRPGGHMPSIRAYLFCLLLCSFCALSLPIFLCLFIISLGCIDKNFICWDFSHLSPNLHIHVLEETTSKEATCRTDQVIYLWSLCLP